MTNRHKTAKGREFNMAAFSAAHGDTIAVGNILRNARGDVVDNRGRIVTTAKDIADAYHNRNPNAVKKVSIKEDGSFPLATADIEVAAEDVVTAVKEYTNDAGDDVVEKWRRSRYILILFAISGTYRSRCR